MTEKDAKQLFEAIKLDNLASFSALITNETNLNVSFGRFPLLSVCYLFNSKKIIKKYQKQLLTINEFYVLNEPFELYLKFRSVAGKSLRIYANKTGFVMPVEMLAVLHKDFSVFKNYKKIAKAETTECNLKKIYELNNQTAKINENKIKISRKKLTYKQKMTLIISNCSLAVAILLTSLILLLFSNVYGFGTSFSPKKIYDINSLLKLDGKNCYATLLEDIEIDDFISLKNFSGTLYGNNKTLTINYDNSNYFIETLNGNVENLNIVYNSKIEKTLNTDLSLFVKENNGKIDNVKISCKKQIILQSDSDNMSFCGIATTNNAYIHNCEISFDADITSATSADNSASFVTITNNGTISNCKVKENSKLKAENVDVGSICHLNNAGAEISSCENYATIEHISENKNWSPNVAGINTINFGTISNSINYGALTCNHLAEESSNSSIFIGGICAENFSLIDHCKNNGSINSNSNVITIYAGGISGYTAQQNLSSPKINYCASNTNFNITKTADTTFMYCGGISGFMVGEIYDCYSCSEFQQAYSQEKQNMIGLMIGASSGQFYGAEINIYLQINNVHCLKSENCDKPLAIVYTAFGYNYVEMLNRADVTIHNEKTEVQQIDIYW